MAEKLKVWAYNDVHNWGSMLAQAAATRGHDAHLFDEPRQPDHGYVFMHMHYHPQVRLFHKRMMQVMAMNPNLKLVPSYRMSVLYDDKSEQARQFSRYMPRTHLLWTPNGAKNFLEYDKGLSFPFISKASEGSSSANVRLVETVEAARQEVRMAFSDIGLKCRHGMTQRGYLLWQQFIPNAGDIRVLAVGRKRLMVKRESRGDKAVTNGTGKIVPILELTKEYGEALQFANVFFDLEDIKWGGVDLVFDKENSRWLVLEATVSWKMHQYFDSRFFDAEGKPVDLLGSQIWNVLMDEIEQGVFG